jgi:hypothetical protein
MDFSVKDALPRLCGRHITYLVICRTALYSGGLGWANDRFRPIAVISVDRHDHVVKTLWIALAFAVAAWPLWPAHACEHPKEADLSALTLANTVVVGRIDHYEIVRDQEARKREPDSNSASYAEDYARFEILVDEVLLGSAPRTLRVTWDGYWMAEPHTMPPGPYLIALRDSRQLPDNFVRGDRAAPTVLQLPCQDAFIIPAASTVANTVRRNLHGRK